MITRRAAGAALTLYGIATFVTTALLGAPGGSYEPARVAAYLSPDHYPAAFALGYLGCLGSLALLPFALRMREELTAGGELAWGLGIAAATTGVIGWFVAVGLDVAMAEGGSAVRSGVPHPVVYTVTEVGNLVSWCAPALFVGVLAILVSRAAAVPRWLRMFSAVAGVCGVLAPFFFTFFVYLLWTLVFGASLLTRRPAPVPTRSRASIV